MFSLAEPVSRRGSLFQVRGPVRDQRLGGNIIGGKSEEPSVCRQSGMHIDGAFSLPGWPPGTGCDRPPKMMRDCPAASTVRCCSLAVPPALSVADRLANRSPESSSIWRPDRSRSASVGRVILYRLKNSMLRMRSTVRKALWGTPDRVSKRSTPDSRVKVFSLTGRRVVGGLSLCFTSTVSWPS